MAAASEIRVPVTAEASAAVRVARIIARHLTALADELEAPEAIITFPDTMTPQQAAEFRERFKAYYDGAQEGRP